MSGRARQEPASNGRLVERSYERPPVGPRSADVYAAKKKAFYSQQQSQPPSDQEDASTSVSSRSQLRRNQVNSLNAPIQYNHHHGQPASQTPQASLGKASDLKNYLPHIVDRRATDNSNYAHDYEPQSYRSRLGYRKQMESAGLSRALGINAHRYDGVGNAIRMARELSKENIAAASNQLKMERGPCPRHIHRGPSMPSILGEPER